MKLLRCKKCGQEFRQSFTDENGKYHVFNHRKYCFDCNPFGQRIGLRIAFAEKYHYSYATKRILICKICHKEYHHKSRREGRNGSTATTCASCLGKVKKFNQKKKIVNYLGGGCYICGIIGSQCIFDNHHIDPSKKEYRLSRSLKKWETLKKELDKTVLLCANCHAELHFGVFELWFLGGRGKIRTCDGAVTP